MDSGCSLQLSTGTRYMAQELLMYGYEDRMDTSTNLHLFSTKYHVHTAANMQYGYG